MGNFFAREDYVYDINSLVPLEGLPKEKCIVSVTSGDANVLVILNDGTLWGIGNNKDFQFGMNNETHSRNYAVFTQITSFPKKRKVVKFLADGRNSLLLLDDGSVWASGNNMFGQLGVGDKIDRDKFTPCILLDKFNKIVRLDDPNVSAVTEVPTLQEQALQVYRDKLTINSYESDAFSKIMDQTNTIIASDVFMPHLYGCSDCERYVKPTIWNKCPYPHRLFTPLATSTSIAASDSLNAKLTKSDAAGPATSHSHKC